MFKKFTKVTEDFKCDNCGAEVDGNGYTNHCPNCLWSKHVDINPGDRASGCCGMMEPVEVITRGDKYTLVHRCRKCLEVKNNKSSPQDSTKAIIGITRK